MPPSGHRTLQTYTSAYINLQTWKATTLLWTLRPVVAKPRKYSLSASKRSAVICTPMTVSMRVAHSDLFTRERGRCMQVIAQDQSEAQLQSASCDKANIEHQCARAEETGLPNACADLVTTAQALHWCAPPHSTNISLAQVHMQLTDSSEC